MTYFNKSAILAALIVPAAAMAGLDVGAQLGSTESDVRAALSELGYVVQDVEVEDGEIEAEVTLDGVAYEIEVAMDSGLIVEIEVEDDEGDSDD